MGNVFDFTRDSRENDREYVCAYDVESGCDEFRTSLFSRCEPFLGSIPPYVKLWVRPGAPADLMGEPLGWPILSDRLFDVFRQYAGQDIQAVELPLFYVDSKKPVLGYKLLNVLRSIQAIDMSRSVTSEMRILGTKIINVITPVYRANLIPQDVHVFRPKESMLRIVVSEELAFAMKSKGAGVALIREAMV